MDKSQYAILKRQAQNLNRKRRVFYFVGLPLLFLLVLWIGHYFLVINITSSMPIGLYRKSFLSANNDIHRGSIVAVCLDRAKAKLAIKSDTLTPTDQCDGGADLLIKQVIAVPNDQVEITPQNMMVTYDNKPHVFLAPRYTYNKAHKAVLTFIDTGRYKSTGYWLYGHHNKQYSWDSRYFGQVSKSNIKYALIPLWVYR